jgi:hypothetical protein
MKLNANKGIKKIRKNNLNMWQQLFFYEDKKTQYVDIQLAYQVSPT